MNALPLCWYGGTFDPVHHGHLRLILELEQQLGQVCWHMVPCGVPAHRPEPQASATHRLHMLRLAVDSAGLAGRVCVDASEVQRSGPSYTVDSLQILRDRYPQRLLLLVVGEDAYAGMAHWRQPERIRSLCHLLVVNRSPEQEQGETVPDYRQHLHQWQQQGCLVGQQLSLTLPYLDIAASAIRQRGRLGHSNYGLLPAAVTQYIEQHRLYHSDPLSAAKNP